MEQTLEPRKLLEVGELGVNRNASADQAVRAFAAWAEARIVKMDPVSAWGVAIPHGPRDLESGHFYLLDRPDRMFYELNIAGDGRWGGYRQDGFEGLTNSFGLKQLAERPREVRSVCRD